MPVRPSTTPRHHGRANGPHDATDPSRHPVSDLRPGTVAAMAQCLATGGEAQFTDVHAIERSWTMPALVGGAVNGGAMTSTSTVTVSMHQPATSTLPEVLGTQPAVLQAMRDGAARDGGHDLATTEPERAASTTVDAAAGRTTMMFAEVPLISMTGDLLIRDGQRSWLVPDVTVTAMDLAREIGFSTTEHASGLGSTRLVA